MSDLRVTAWNFTDDEGRPIFEIDEDMTYAEFEARVKGQFACVSAGMLRVVSVEALERALAEGR